MSLKIKYFPFSIALCSFVFSQLPQYNIYGFLKLRYFLLVKLHPFEKRYFLSTYSDNMYTFRFAANSGSFYPIGGRNNEQSVAIICRSTRDLAIGNESINQKGLYDNDGMISPGVASCFCLIQISYFLIAYRFLSAY